MSTLPEGQRLAIISASSNLERKKKIILGIEIAGAVTGSLCIMLLGIIITCYNKYIINNYYSKCSNIGHPYFGNYHFSIILLCGMWIFVTGRLGIRIHGFMVNTYLGYALLGAISLVVLLITCIVEDFLRDPNADVLLGLTVLLLISFSISFVLYKSHASYSCSINCRATADCGKNSCDNNKINGDMGIAVAGAIAWGIVFIICTVPLILILDPHNCSAIDMERPPQKQYELRVSQGMNQADQYGVIEQAPGTYGSQTTLSQWQQMSFDDLSNVPATAAACHLTQLTDHLNGD